MLQITASIPTQFPPLSSARSQRSLNSCNPSTTRASSASLLQITASISAPFPPQSSARSQLYWNSCTRASAIHERPTHCHWSISSRPSALAPSPLALISSCSCCLPLLKRAPPQPPNLRRQRLRGPQNNFYDHPWRTDETQPCLLAPMKLVTRKR